MAEDFLAQGFVAGSLRGKDSSGIALIETISEQVDFQKLPIPGMYFIQDTAAQQLLSDANDPLTIAICHTRAATSGKIGLNQAHPFLIEGEEDNPREIIGVHNGTLNSWYNHKLSKYYNVDSEWALALIYNEGMKAFEEFRGAYCFVWWDSENSQVLNIALNDQRPMHIAFTTTGSMAYASEPGMLYWLLERNGLNLDGPILKLASDYWYKFNVNDLKNFTKEELPAVRTVSNYQAPSSFPTRTSTMENVGRVISRAIAEQAKSTSNNLVLVSDTPKPSVTMEEVEQAKALGLSNMRGSFIPTFADPNANEVWGAFVYNGTDEIEAVIRNVVDLPINPDETWDTTVIGMVDDGLSITAICSKPRIALVPETMLH